MPVIPRIQSTRSIEVTSPPRMSGRAIARSEAAQASVVKAIEGAEDALVQMRDFRQKAEAQAYALKRLYEVRAAADEDLDFDPAKYETEIQKIGAEASKTITGQMAKDEFMSAFTSQASGVMWGIRNTFREKELKAGQAIVDYTKRQIEDAYAGMNDAEKMSSIVTFKNMLKDSVKKGIFNKGTAAAIDLDFQKRVQNSVVERDILDDPQTAEAELNKGREGKYSGISESDRTEFIKKSRDYAAKYKSQAELELARRQSAREDELTKMLIEGSLDEAQVRSDLEGENISPDFAKATIMYLRSPRAVDAETKDDTFVEFANRFSDLLDKGKKATLAEISQFRNDVIKAHAQGKLDAGDSQKYLRDSNDAVNERLDKATDEVLSKAYPKSLLQRLSVWSDEYAEKRPDLKAKLYRNLMERLRKGEDANEAFTRVIREHVQDELSNVMKNSAAYQRANGPIGQQSNTLVVIGPSGQKISIPADKLRDAEKRGYKRAE